MCSDWDLTRPEKLHIKTQNPTRARIPGFPREISRDDYLLDGLFADAAYITTAVSKETPRKQVASECGRFPVFSLMQ